ncbi:hypothetical protein [Nocardiopsis sp. JB363]|uniref:hypothetical protein n=1 Tax=Nocardiopsis sp. JB363 TaxID=1434837 RepID=UPI000B35BFDC|nr:hypothetical protein [Nocardiopsis sp. JB363]
MVDDTPTENPFDRLYRQRRGRGVDVPVGDERTPLLPSRTDEDVDEEVLGAAPDTHRRTFRSG